MKAKETILAGIDGSPSSVHALEWAAKQAELTDADVHVVITWEWPVYYGWSPPIPTGLNPAADAAQVANEVLTSVRAHHPDVHFDLLVLEGHPAPALVEASRNADLLVVGSRGHGEFAGMLLGSVSEYCVTHSGCPVVVVRDE